MVYEKYAYLIRTKQDRMTRVKIGRFDYNICSKDKNDLTPWSKVIPHIEPQGLPLFNVGKIDDKLELKIKNDENKHRLEKINFIEEVIEQQKEFNHIFIDGERIDEEIEETDEMDQDDFENTMKENMNYNDE